MSEDEIYYSPEAAHALAAEIDRRGKIIADLHSRLAKANVFVRLQGRIHGLRDAKVVIAEFGREYQHPAGDEWDEATEEACRKITLLIDAKIEAARAALKLVEKGDD